MKTVEVLGGCDCGGKVIPNVEVASPRRVIDRRVLTSDVDAGFGLITCVRKWFSQMARLHSFWRRGTGGTPDFQSAVAKWVSSVEARNKTMRRCQVRREVFCETCCELG